MKVTAIIPDELLKQVKKYTRAKNTTSSLIIALSDWISRKKIADLNAKVQKDPLDFKDDFDSIINRERNRNR